MPGFISGWTTMVLHTFLILRLPMEKRRGKSSRFHDTKKDGTPSVSYSDYGSPSGNSNSNAASCNGRQAMKSNAPTTDRSRQVAKRDVPKVELYTTSWCPYCKKAANFFRSRGIPFKEYDIEKDKAAARRKKQLDKKGSGVPFAMINGKPIHGFSEAAYENALK